MNRLFKYLLISCLYFVFTPFAQADLGNAAVYHTSLKMKNGASKTCYVLVTGYEEYTYLENGSNVYCNNAGVLKIIRDYGSKNHLVG